MQNLYVRFLRSKSIQAKKCPRLPYLTLLYGLKEMNEMDYGLKKMNEMDYGLKKLNEMNYGLKKLNEMDCGLKEMNNAMTKADVMRGCVMMSWQNLSVMKPITEQRDDQNPNLRSIFSLGHQWC